MFHLSEHAGWERAHDPHMWWRYNCRESSPKTCPLCLSLHGTHYRGDELDIVFPFHIHRRVNMIKPMTHLHCRCRLEWTGRSKNVLLRPHGWLEGKRKIPEIPKTVAGRPVSDVLVPSQLRLRKKIVRYARETWRHTYG